MYSYAGNFKSKLPKNKIDEYLPIESKSNFNCYQSDFINYHDLPTELQQLCQFGSIKLCKVTHLETNPRVIIERRENIIEARKSSHCCMNLLKSKNSHDLAIHADNEGPANGPCYSILYYYQIDDNIIDGNLYFYEDDDDKKPPIDNFNPKSGDVISFNDGIQHCPSQFYTESITPVIRGLLGIFVLL